MVDKKISEINGGVTVAPQAGDLIPAARSGGNILLDPADIAAMGGGGAPSDFMMPVVDNFYYYPPYDFLFRNQALYGDTLAAVPYWRSHDESFNRIGFRLISPEAGCEVRFGLYENAVNNRPGNLIVDLGAIPTDAAGDLEITVDVDLVKNTIYWVATHMNVSTSSPDNVMVSMTIYDARPNVGPMGRIGTWSPIDENDTKGTIAIGYETPYTGTLPATFDGDAQIYGWDIPAFWFRRV